MKNKKLFRVTRMGGQAALIVAAGINEAARKARTFFRKSYVSRTVIEKVEFIGTIDA